MKPRIFYFRRQIIPLFICSFIFGNCNQETRYHTETGLVYRIVSSPGKDSTARMGNTVKLHYIQKAGDSIMENNFDKMPLYWMVMPHYGNRYNPLETFDYGLKEGDSLVITQRIDSMLKKHILDSLPKYLKPTDEWVTYMKVEKVFRNDSLLEMDKLKEQKKVDEAQAIAGDQRIRDYLKENHINAVKTDGGVYVQIIEQGTGAQIDTGKRVGVKYDFVNQTTKKLFDTNRDKSFRHGDTLTFKVGSRFMIKAVDQSMKLLKEGSHAKMFIPTMMAFGSRPPKGNLRAYDDLMFEVWVLKVE
jgi:FKBP-type peptidyl-prolyl cis-trans isomerase FkpA